jgi:hypothetical protein
VPTRVDDLGGESYGLLTADLEILKADLKSAALGAKPLRRMVRLASSPYASECQRTGASPRTNRLTM